jgi:hypothetical protein
MSSLRIDLPSAAVLREKLTYCALTGEFKWRTPESPKVKAGDVAGYLSKRGYWQIKIGSRAYKAHRLAWVYMTGHPPTSDIDHDNRNKSDNRWRNLRLASQSQNTANSKVREDMKGVSRVTGCHDRWQARISINGETRHLGSFDSPTRAHAAYVEAAAHLFGDFANGGAA